MDITSFLNQDKSQQISVAGTSKVADNEVIGIGGFFAYAVLDETKDLTSTAPDITLEDGSIVSDTIFLTPVMINISGFISDIFFRDSPAGGVTAQPLSIIGTTSQYLPSLTPSQESKIDSITSSANSVKSRVDNITAQNNASNYNGIGDNSNTKSHQEQFLDVVEKIHFSKSLIDIESPFRVYQNMRITNISTTKTNESDAIKFSIEAKQISLRKLKTVTVASVEPAPKPSQGLQGATEAQADKGTTSGKLVDQGQPEGGEKSQSLLAGILG